MKKFISTLILILFITNFSTAQKIKFGKVSKAELEEKFYPQDSSANAVMLYKKRRTTFEFTQNTGWMITTKIHQRIKIYNKEGYDWATKKIELYQGDNDETVSIKAYTFNLVNGKVEKIKLKSNHIFIEEINKYWKRKKFTMPNLTEGCVIEWEYTFRTQYFSHLHDMVFQYGIPLKYIDSEVKIPEYFEFKYLPNSYYPITINKSSKNRTLNFTYKTDGIDVTKRGGGSRKNSTSNNAKVQLKEEVYSSIEKNIPALKDEPYTNNINNYRSKVTFELTAYRPKNGIPKFYNNNWSDVTKTIYQSPSFGEQLKKSSYFKDDLANLINNTSSNEEKLAKILQFVKSNIKWDEFNGIYTNKGVRKAYKDGVGNVAEINLILTAMLRKAGLNANPILVSTRDHGIPLFPTKKGFNYIIAGVEIQDAIILLDATEKYSLPNVLPLRALNWEGRIVRKNGSSNAVPLFPKAHSKDITYLNVKIDNEGLVSGTERDMYSNLSALTKRTKNNNSAENELIAKLEKKYNDIEIDEFKVSNKDDLSKSLIYQFKFETDNQVEIIGDKMYFSPLLFHTEKENPFKLEERKFPVDFGAPWEDKNTISISIPEDYKIETIPENAAFALPENLGVFKFITTVKGNKLQVISSTKINSSILSPLYYDALKEFYKKVIEKQLEKVILVKK